jgi:hypothetical protein
MKAPWIMVEIYWFESGKFVLKIGDKFTKLYIIYTVGISDIIAVPCVFFIAEPNSIMVGEYRPFYSGFLAPVHKTLGGGSKVELFWGEFVLPTGKVVVFLRAAVSEIYPHSRVSQRQARKTIDSFVEFREISKDY